MSDQALGQAILDALAASFDFNKAAAAFGGDHHMLAAINSVMRTEAQNGPMLDNRNRIQNRDDIFRAFADDEPSHTADRFTRLMEKWDRQSRPALPAIAYGWLDQLGLTISPDAYQKKLNDLVLLLGTRAEMVQGKPAPDAQKLAQEPDFHNRIHFLHVLQTVGHLVEKNDHMLAAHEEGAINLTGHDKTLLIIAALAHDLDHPGRGNAKDSDGNCILYQNEEQSFALADRLFEACNLDGKDRGKILTLLRITDPNGPHKIVKAAIKAHMKNATITLSDIVPGEEDRYRDLLPLLSDKKLCFMAAMLSDADLYVSAGAGMTAQITNSEKLTREMKTAGIDMDFTTAGSRDFFFKNIVGEDGFASPAGRVAFNDVYFDMVEETAREIAAAKPAQKLS